MKRFTRALATLTVACASLATSACEDPIIAIGDLPGIMRRIAGIPMRLGDDVDPESSRNTMLSRPRGLAVAEDGTLYIADSNNARIVAVTPTGGAAVVAGADGCTGECLVEPHGLAIAPDGSLWIADPAANRLFRLDPDTRVLEVRAGTGVAGDSPDLTAPLEADLDSPAGVAIASDGTVYFTERDRHRVRYIHPVTGIRTLAGTGEPGYSPTNPATEAQLNSPTGLAMAGSLLYVADEGNDRVRMINIPGSSIRDIAGNGVGGYTATDTIAISAKLSRPRALAVSPDRSQLFIADALNDRVRVVNLTNGRIRSFAGTGSPTFTAEGIDAGDTSLDDPAGLAFHPEGVLFIADTGHQIVWRTPLRF